MRPLVSHPASWPWLLHRAVSVPKSSPEPKHLQVSAHVTFPAILLVKATYTAKSRFKECRNRLHLSLGGAAGTLQGVRIQGREELVVVQICNLLHRISQFYTPLI